MTMRRVAEVIKCEFISPTVKWFLLHDPCPPYPSFKAGQWIDVFTPNTDLIAGYSIVSPPSKFAERGQFELAVKTSDFAPTTWMIERCNIEETFQYEFGGEVYYNENIIDKNTPLMLIAGGVGINPLLSILQHSLELNLSRPIRFIYSAKTQEELIYMDQICQLQNKNQNVQIKFFITSHTDTDVNSSTKPQFRYRRPNQTDLEWSNLKSSECFICGPGQMIDDFSLFLRESKVSDDKIHFERWW